MKSKLLRGIILVVAVVMLFSMTALSAMATTLDMLDGKISVADDANTGKLSGDTYTATAKGGILSQKTSNITITNVSADKAKISFDYAIQACAAFTIDGVNKVSATEGSYDKVLNPDETIVIKMTSNKGLSNTTATLTITNMTYAVVGAETTVTFLFDSTKATVKLNNATATTGTAVTIDPAVGLPVAVTAKTGYNFVGWKDVTDNSFYTVSAKETMYPGADMTLEAVLVDSTPHFLVSNQDKLYLYEGFEAGLAAAQSSDSKVMILANNATLPAGEYTVPAGIILQIPYNAEHTLCLDEPYMIKAYTKPTVYRTLTMPTGTTLNVEGGLSLSAMQSAIHPKNGWTNGALPFINMAEGSLISVKDGGNLYCWGYITGSGAVEILSGGTVYECFQLADFRGGDGTSQMANNNKGVFPMSQYYIQNVEVPMTLYAGCSEFAYMSTSTAAGLQGDNVPFVGVSGAMFKLTSGYVVKDYIEGTGRLKVSSYGDISVSTVAMTMDLGGLGGETTLDSADFNLPISNHMTIEAVSGHVELAQHLVLLPGSELYVRKDATCTLKQGVRIVVWDMDQWTEGYCGHTNVQYAQLGYVPGGDSVEGRLKDALVQIDGTVDASQGAIYTTAGGANVYSTGTGKLIAVPGLETKAYTAKQSVDSFLGISYQVIDYPEFAIQPLVLKNADETTVSTTESGTYTYYAAAGKWDTPSHAYAKAVTEPTCEAEGYTTYTCAVCGHSYVGDTVDALGHTEVIDKAVAPSCTVDGLTEGSHCSVCGKVIIAQAVDPSLDHNGVLDNAEDATCTTAGKTQGIHCERCGEVLKAQEEIPALGHTEVIDEGAAATCTTAGLTEGKHCDRCGEVIVAQDEIPALGHNEVIDNASDPTCENVGLTEGKHCDRCGEVIIAQDEIPALGHSYVANTTPADCENDGLTVYTCSVCGDSYEEVIPAGHTIEYVAAVVPANCQETGHDEYWHCTVCDYYFGDAEASYQINPAWINYTGDCVRPEGSVPCAVVPCVICGEDSYGEPCDRGDAPVCQDATCVNCGETVYGWGCNYNTGDEETPLPLCQSGNCVYCGKHYDKLFDCENGSWAPCSYDGECAYGCGKQYPATGVHELDDPCEGGLCWLCRENIEGAHNYESVVTPPQIGVQGYTTHTCVACGDSYVDSYVDALPEEVVLPGGTGTLTFAGASLALQSDLTMNIGIHKDVIKSGNYTNLRVEVSMYDVKFDQLNTSYYDATNYVVSGNYILCSLTGNSPRKMNDTITMKMYATYEGVEYCAEMTTSVAAYCYKTFETSSSNLKLMAVIADLLNFGAAHQTYTGYNTANLVNATMTEDQKAYASSYDLGLVNNLNAQYSVLEGATASFAGAMVSLTEKVEVQFYVSVKDLSGVTLKIVCDGTTFTLKEDQFVAYGNFYIVTFTGLQAKQLRSLMYATLYRDGVAISNTLQYSVESYAFANINATDKKLVELLKTMMYYGDSANNYFKK